MTVRLAALLLELLIKKYHLLSKYKIWTDLNIKNGKFYTDNLNDDVIERYVIYLASRELGVAVSQVSEEEEKMMGRLVSLNSELKKHIEFL